MARLLLIVNPSASGFTGALLRDVTTTLKTAFEVETAWPSDAVESQRTTAKAATEGVDLVAAMGGDGVVHHVANGLVGTSAALAVIPAGTTNVLARILGIPPKADAAARMLAEGVPVGWAPLGRLEAETTGGHWVRYAMFAAGIGYDADVVAHAEQHPHRKLNFGGLHFARSAAGVFLRSYRTKPATLRVESNGRTADGTAVMVQIHWPYTYFGRIPLKVTRRPTPGPAIFIMDRIPTWRTPAIVARSALGRDLSKIPGAEVWTGAEETVIRAEPAAPLQADGELLGHVEELRVSLASETLLVAAPRPTADD